MNFWVSNKSYFYLPFNKLKLSYILSFSHILGLISLKTGVSVLKLVYYYIEIFIFNLKFTNKLYLIYYNKILQIIEKEINKIIDLYKII